MPHELIEERGSLILTREDDIYWVKFRDQPQVKGTLLWARKWFEIDNVRLNGSQAQTVVEWNKTYRKASK